MPTVPMPKPMPEVLRERDRECTVGMFIKARDDAIPPKKGVTRLSGSSQSKTWYENDNRWRYSEGHKTVGGKSMGGKFASAPDNAQSYQRPGYKRKKKKEK